MRQGESDSTAFRRAKSNRTALVYFVCSCRDEAAELECEMRDFAEARGFSVTGVFFDRADSARHTLLALMDVCTRLERVPVLIPNKAHLESEASADAVIAFARNHGLRFICADNCIKTGHDAEASSKTNPHIDPQVLRFLKHIRRYCGIEQSNARDDPHFRQCEAMKGRLPLGYTFSSGGVCIDKRAAEMVREIFELFASGKGAGEIERAIRIQYSGEKCPSRSQIYAIVQNRRYIGDTVADTALPPIVSNRLWLRTCNSLMKRGPSEEHCFLLNGVYLRGCGMLKPMERCRALHAPAYGLQSNNGGVFIDAARIEREVETFASRLIAAELPALNNACLGALKRVKQYKDRAAELESRLSELRRRIDETFASESNRAIMGSVRGFDELSARLKLALMEKAYVDGILDSLTLTEQQIEDFFEHFSAFSTLCGQEKRYFLEMLLNSIELKDDELILSVCALTVKRVHIKTDIKTVCYTGD